MYNRCMNKFIVAVSGGVDSVVLLDKLVKIGKSQLIVTHFDHGIRPDSADDAKFVAGLAKKYDLVFETGGLELGANASEDLARQKRYAFLRTIANKYDAQIVTAHHMDDLVETIAINLKRGTGWRGLASMDSPDIDRPLISVTKAEILTYAKKNHLKWREDSTNRSDKYLRNRLRRQTMKLDEKSKIKLLYLWQRQKVLKNLIEQEIHNLIKKFGNSRYFLTNIDDDVACEILRVMTKGELTRPQIRQLLMFIKTAKSGKEYVSGDVKVTFTARNFVIDLIK